MTANPDDPQPDVPEVETEHREGEPVAQPPPSLDSARPIAAGGDAIEKFLVATDTEGGD